MHGNAGGHHITFLPLNSVPELGKKAKFRNMFDIAYFSNRYSCTCMPSSLLDPHSDGSILYTCIDIASNSRICIL